MTWAWEFCRKKRPYQILKWLTSVKLWRITGNLSSDYPKMRHVWHWPTQNLAIHFTQYRQYLWWICWLFHYSLNTSQAGICTVIVRSMTDWPLTSQAATILNNDHHNHHLMKSMRRGNITKKKIWLMVWKICEGFWLLSSRCPRTTLWRRTGECR